MSPPIGVPCFSLFIDLFRLLWTIIEPKYRVILAGSQSPNLSLLLSKFSKLLPGLISMILTQYGAIINGAIASVLLLHTVFSLINSSPSHRTLHSGFVTHSSIPTSH